MHGHIVPSGVAIKSAILYLLPALFGRFLFLYFTLALAHRLGFHPAVSPALLVNILMLFELALLLAAFSLVPRWAELAAP
jgi:hypothetical protein